jgi:regulatory protein
MGASAAEKAQNHAFRLLTRRPRSEKELRDRLRQNYPDDITDQVIQNCKNNGYLNDNIFALERTRQLALHGLKGNRAIAMDLSRKGLDQTAIANALQTIRRELSEGEAIKKLIAKKQKDGTASDRHEREKMGRYLLSKGFTAGLVFEILNQQLCAFHMEYEEGVFYHDDGK